MSGTTPPQTSGHKRTAEHSPKLIPDKTSHQLINDVIMEDEAEEIIPSRLEDNFGASPQEGIVSLGDDKINWLDPETYANLLHGPDPPRTGEYYPYDFDEDDVFTAQTI